MINGNEYEQALQEEGNRFYGAHCCSWRKPDPLAGSAPCSVTWFILCLRVCARQVPQPAPRPAAAKRASLALVLQGKAQALGKGQFVPKHWLCHGVIHKLWDFLFVEWQASLFFRLHSGIILLQLVVTFFPTQDLQPLHRNFPAFMGFKLYPSAPSSWAVLQFPLGFGSGEIMAVWGGKH